MTAVPALCGAVRPAQACLWRARAVWKAQSGCEAPRAQGSAGAVSNLVRGGLGQQGVGGPGHARHGTLPEGPRAWVYQQWHTLSLVACVLACAGMHPTY